MERTVLPEDIDAVQKADDALVPSKDTETFYYAEHVRAVLQTSEQGQAVAQRLRWPTQTRATRARKQKGKRREKELAKAKRRNGKQKNSVLTQTHRPLFPWSLVLSAFRRLLRPTRHRQTS